MKRFLFLLICSVLFFACGEHSNDVVPVKEGGSLAGGWWLIYVVFGILVPAWLIYQGWKLANKGTHFYDEQGRSHSNKTPRPWHEHKLSQGGIALAVVALIGLIVRLLTYN